MTASNHAFSAFSFISFVLTAIPFAWHLEAWNTGTCIYMGWISIGNLFLFVDSVVWDGNVTDWAPVWCDIVTKFLIGVSVAIPAAALCINRRLYHIVRVSTVTRTIAEKRRGVLVDLAIGVGIPIVIMILHVVVQGHRYDIYEDIGCWPSIFNTQLTYVLVLGPTLGLAILACIYSVLSFLALRRNYVQFRKLLSSNGTNSATANRYIRLMCLAGVEALFDVPANVYVIITQATTQLVQPWISWEETHFDFGVIDQFPREVWSSDPVAVATLERVRWTIVICGLIFFAFFGFADEAIKNYKLVYNCVARKLGLRLVDVSGLPRSATGSKGNGSSGVGTNGDAKKGGLLRGNGTESWMNSFGAFANKVKLVVLQSSGSVSFSAGNSTACTATSGTTIPVYVSREMVEKRDADSMSMLTTLSEFSCAAGSYSQDGHTIQKQPSGLTYAGSLDEEKNRVSCYSSDESASVYSEPETPVIILSPPAPTVPPKDWPQATSSLRVPSPVMSARTPPRQTIPTSVSVSPTPSSSFLDLSASEVEISPIRDIHSADNRV
ncbi:STE3-domain-containing protein [Macrolepiota fuliginosa MF-IS2]|uniref:STE3-domain-containing protein n=1 Tax=Macrolepiota fuliginosa MF-IS2 TaxID=1400762 RepID=A0A9P5XJ24_9AGAR|nr:STE3-domain-containing protein [Macrolepiota fuliginosa MF-IS2]